ncbi:translation elongation factor Ts [bacterium]|nr:translation elongation factor Ts [bacterium]
MVNIEKVKQLREETGVSVIECKKALEESKGDIKKARELLKEKGEMILEKKAQREAKEGIIESYIHPNKKIGVLIELNCETDFVARSKKFQELAHELCLQIAAMAPENVETLMEQPWIKDETKTIKGFISEAIVKLGENIIVKRFQRFQI